MSDSSDWRVENLLNRNLEGTTLRFARYLAPDPDWDHDHCVGCQDKFMESDAAPDALHEGYYAEELGEWICPECFELCRTALKWTLSPDGR